MDKNIYISGFMGTGKSSIGRLLSNKLDRGFIDTDHQIEQSSEMSIDEIFTKLGEPFFRDIEKEVIQELGNQKKLVISLGGGAILNEENQKIFSEGALVFLDTPLTIIKERLSRTSHRPLAKRDDEIDALYEERIATYRQAPYIIDCQSHSPDEICQMIIKKVILDEN